MNSNLASSMIPQDLPRKTWREKSPGSGVGLELGWTLGDFIPKKNETPETGEWSRSLIPLAADTLLTLLSTYIYTYHLIYVCVCMCICICVWVSMYIYIYLCVYVYIYMYINITFMDAPTWKPCLCSHKAAYRGGQQWLWVSWQSRPCKWVNLGFGW